MFGRQLNAVINTLVFVQCLHLLTYLQKSKCEHGCLSQSVEREKVEPVETIDHLEVTAEIFLGEMFQHASINKTLHECAAVLR